MYNQYIPVPYPHGKQCLGTGPLDGQYEPIQISFQEPVPLSSGGMSLACGCHLAGGVEGRLRIRKMHLWLLLDAIHGIPQGVGGLSQNLADG